MPTRAIVVFLGALVGAELAEQALRWVERREWKRGEEDRRRARLWELEARVRDLECKERAMVGELQPAEPLKPPEGEPC